MRPACHRAPNLEQPSNNSFYALSLQKKGAQAKNNRGRASTYVALTFLSVASALHSLERSLVFFLGSKKNHLEWLKEKRRSLRSKPFCVFRDTTKMMSFEMATLPAACLLIFTDLHIPSQVGYCDSGCSRRSSQPLSLSLSSSSCCRDKWRPPSPSPDCPSLVPGVASPPSSPL